MKSSKNLENILILDGHNSYYIASNLKDEILPPGDSSS